MLIRFGFGMLYIGKPSSFAAYNRDMSIALYIGWRGEVPKGELEWHHIWRADWNWLPKRVYKKINVGPSNVIDSSRWTGRDRRLVGIGSWRSEIWSHRSTHRSKMYVYLTGSKERMGEHTLHVAPAAITKPENCPSDWFVFDDDQKRIPRQMAIKFVSGRASVDSNLGEWLIERKFAQRTNQILRQRSGAVLGSLANAIAGR